MILSLFKRICDKNIGGCGKEVDVTSVVTVIKNKRHLCRKCAGKIIAQSLDKNQ